LDEYTHANHAYWDEAVAIHAASEFYDVESFIAGRNTLKPVEREELGDVSGKTLLHLQCHFGLDTLSWARLGATVTGLDFSEQAVATAGGLAERTGIADATFVCGNVYDAPSLIDGQFDIVFTSYGALCWLGDLARWASAAAALVRPGGVLYVAEFHPFAQIFDDEPDVTELRPRYPYFPGGPPVRFDGEGTYADLGATLTNRVKYNFPYTVAGVVSSVIDAGLRVEFLHEFPFTEYKMFPFLRRDDDGMYRLPSEYGDIPLQFSVRARKPAMDARG
jgi:SAM-dependent methyltransferase